MADRTYTCADCGITLACPNQVGVKPKRCPEHRAQARSAAVRAGHDAWKARRVAQGLPKQPWTRRTPEQLAERRRRWRERNPVPTARSYTCMDCGREGLYTRAKGTVPKRCPEDAALAEKRGQAARAARWEAENHDRARASRQLWRDRNPELARESIRDWHRRNPERSREHARNRAARRRLRELATQVEWIDRATVFDRDQWMCGICTWPVNPELRFPDPGSASVDHVIPLSRGGSHTYDNVQCSHLRCNQRKSAKTPRTGTQ